MHEEDSRLRQDALAELATDLRRLRTEAGSPTLVKLASLTEVSKSALSDALNGKQLPSERTLTSLVRELGDDPGVWLERRARLTSIPPVDSGVDSSPSRTPDQRPRTVTLRAAVLLSVLAFGAGAALAAGITAAAAGTVAGAATTATPEGPPLLPVETGVDPARTSCVDDAEPAASETRNESYVLQVMWSEDCQAAWGRIIRNDDQSSSNSVHIEIAPRGDDADRQRQEATVADVQVAYTHLIVRTDGDTRLCAVGSVTVADETIDLGDPLCT